MRITTGALIATMVAGVSVVAAAVAGPTVQQGKPRPHLFYTASDIEAFAIAVLSDPARSWYEEFVLDSAVAALDSGIYTGNDIARLRDYFEYLDEVAVAARADPDPSFRQALVAFGIDVLLTTAAHYNSMRLDRFWTSTTSPSAMALALLYDTLHDELSPAERTTIVNDLFLALLADSEGAPTFNEWTNKGAIMHAAYGVVALAIEDQEHFDRAYGTMPDDEPSFRWAIAEGYGSDGIWTEPSQHYHQYTMDLLLPFALATYHASEARAPEVFATTPSLAEIYDSLVSVAYPSLVLVPTGDSRWLRNLRFNHGEVLNRFYPDRDSIEWVLSNAYDPVSVDRAHTNFVWEIVHIRDFGDPGAHQPISNVYVDNGAGFGVLRYGSDTDQHFCFIDFALHQPNHDHRDKLSIYLAGAHRIPVTSVIREDRDGFGHTIFQNTVVIDEWSQSKAPGSLIDFEHTADYELQLVAATATDAYSGVEVYERMLLMCEDAYVVDVFTASQPGSHDYDWVQHRVAMPAFAGVSQFAPAAVAARDGYDALSAVRSADVVAEQVAAISYSAEGGAIHTLMAARPGDLVYVANAPGPRHSLEHPVYFVRRSSDDGVQFTALHAISDDGVTTVTSLAPMAGGGVDSPAFGATVQTLAGVDDLLADRRQGVPSAFSIGDYALAGRAARVHRQGDTVSAVFLLGGSYLARLDSVLIDTFGAQACIASEGDVVDMSGDVTSFCVYAPSATTVRLNGAPVPFLRSGDYVVSDTGGHNLPPAADPGGPYSGSPGEVVGFDGSGSLDPEGQPLTYSWEFGDGSVAGGVTPNHVYAEQGQYTVTLTVDDGQLSSAPAATMAFIQATAPAPEPTPVPTVTRLDAAQPNPFGSATEIGFDLASPEAVRISIYDVHGRLLRRLVDAKLAAGRHRALWDGRALDGGLLPGGVYFYRLEAPDLSATRKLLLIR